jgi:hypothetical protein
MTNQAPKVKRTAQNLRVALEEQIALLMSQKLLRMRQVAGIGSGLRPDVPKLKIHLRQRASLVEA